MYSMIGKSNFCWRSKSLLDFDCRPLAAAPYAERTGSNSASC